MIFLPIKTYVNDRLSSLPKMKKKRLKNAAAPEEKKCSTRPSFLLRKAWFWPIFAPAVKHLEMAAIWRWCALGSIWCVSPDIATDRPKAATTVTQPLKAIPEVQPSVERKRNSSSFPSHWGKWPKRKWFGRAERLQFLQISPFSPGGWPDTDPSYSGWIETFDTLGPGSKHKTLKFIVNFSFFKICTRPLNRASFTDRPVSFGPLFPPPSLCGSPLHSWTCFKGR